MKFTGPFSMASMLSMVDMIVGSSSPPFNDVIQVEAVLSHYDEDISWIDDVRKEEGSSIQYTVYSKNNLTRPVESIQLPNVGRESHTYLHHIVQNYHHLAEWTVFSQAAAPTFGFRANNAQSGHMCSGVFWENYTEPHPDGWYMVQTVATRFPEVWHSDRLDMMYEIDPSDGDVCPSSVDPEIGWSMWWHDKFHPVVGFPRKTEPVDFYNKFIVGTTSNNHTYDSFTLNYANGGRFAVSRERILMRSLEYYEALLGELSRAISPIEGYYMESMWYDVFHPERLQAEHGPVCDMPSLPRSTAEDHATMLIHSTDQLNSYMDSVAAATEKQALRPRVLKHSSAYVVGKKKKAKKGDDSDSTSDVLGRAGSEQLEGKKSSGKKASERRRIRGLGAASHRERIKGTHVA